VPGMFTTVWFQAEIPGRHVVFCAEYCGASHSQMIAHVNVLTPEQWTAFRNGAKINNIPLVGNGIPMKPAADATGASLGADSVKTSAAAPKLNGLAQQGKSLTESKGCVACHLPGGERGIGPSFHGLYGSTVSFTDGSKAVADENYIKESLESPNAKIAQGFSPVMPTFKGQLSLPEQNAIIEYIKSLKQ